jgi:hypothetical protein
MSDPLLHFAGASVWIVSDPTSAIDEVGAS